MSLQESIVNIDTATLTPKNNQRSTESLFKANSMTPTKNSKLSINSFILQNELGKGAFGRVVKAMSKNTGKTYALKILNKDFMNRLNKANEALSERELLKIINHPNVIKLFQAFTSSTELFYVLEYCNNGSLKDFLSQNGSLPSKVAQFYLAEIVNVLRYFEEKNIAHRDIKPGNIMLDDEHHLKFIDFGTATFIGSRYDIKERKFVQADKMEKELVGTAEYASPEMLNHTVTNEKSCDLWALGCILYQFIHNKTPFKGICEKETIENIKLGQLSMNKEIDPVAMDLINQLLTINVTNRLGMNGIKEIMEHPYFNGINFDDLHKSPVPKIIKSHSVYCLIPDMSDDDKDYDNSEEDDVEDLYPEDISSYMVNSSLFCKKNSSNQSTIRSSTSTVVSSPRNSHSGNSIVPEEFNNVKDYVQITESARQLFY